MRATVELATTFDMAIIVILKALADRSLDRVDIQSLLESQGDGQNRALIERESAAIGIDPPW